MSRPEFSREYRTYGEWLKALPRDSRYAKEIIRKHQYFPDKSLSQLRKLRISDYDISKTDWSSLSSSQKSDRKLSLEILREIRKGETLTNVIEKRGINRQFALKNLGGYLQKSGKEWKVKPTDTMEVEMSIFGTEGHVSIVTKSSKDRSLIGEHFALVQKALRTNDPSLLDKFKDLRIVDADGIEHYLETDLEKLYEITEAQEEPEFFEIYKE
ncbi:hypothetical protein RE476_00950 [Methanolobus mangrovi]|uniref:Uncharacterized protein n=1 Tax=Methanolobus mangrovi TaxID=3072977 RepID=A0AA51UFU5_9EURY|nr:hypothetical protein [Methanolobus mangrovi]WMW22416.1 hypothetical protein RE476_00950 [Methanolobus mangrovi]